MGLAGKTVLVTGSASNIGRGIVLAYAANGSNVVILDIDEQQGGMVAVEANQLGGGGKTVVLKTDVTNYGDVKATVSKSLEQFGHVDILINDVGWDELWLFVDTEASFWEKIVALNYMSVVNSCHAVLPAMIARKSGSIVSIASDAGRVGEYMESVYSGCKGATIALTKSIAKEVGRFGIRANAVCPAITIPPSPKFIGKESMWQKANLTCRA